MYQLCPKCQGQGSVSKPPWVSGDVHQWTSTVTAFVCDVCHGAKVLRVEQVNSAPANYVKYNQPQDGREGVMEEGLVLVQNNPDMAVDLSGGPWNGWLFWRHPDGQFVSKRKLKPWEIMWAEDQRDEGIVIDAGEILTTKSGVRYG